MADGKVTRAELAEAVRELREEVARLRAGQHVHACHGSPCCVAAMSHAHCNWGHCWCYTFHAQFQAYPLPGCAGGAMPLVYTGYVGSVGTSEPLNVSAGFTSVAAGVPQVASYQVPGYVMGGGSSVSSGYTVSASN